MNIPIYFINLQSRQDRKIGYLEQFKGTDLRPERIEAVSGLAAGEEHFVTKEVAACWLSHQATFAKFLESNSTHAIIMEDDALLTKDTLKFLNRLQNINLNAVDILQFGYLTHNSRIDFPTYDPFPLDLLNLRKYVGHWVASHDSIHRYWLRITRFFVRQLLPIFYGITKITKMKIRQRSSEKFYQTEFEIRKKYGLKEPIVYHSIEAGSHAYVISRNCAEKLLSFNNPVFLPADLALMSIGRSKNFVTFRTSKSICGQNESASSINNRSLIVKDLNDK